MSHFSHHTFSLSFFHVYLCHFVFSYQLHLYSFHLCLCLCVCLCLCLCLCLCIYLREVVGRSSMTNMAATLHRLLITLITQMCLSPPTYILYNDFLLFPFFYHHFSQYLYVKCFCCSFNFSIPALQANTVSLACMGTGRQSVSCLPTFNHHYLSAMIPQRPGLITNSN